MSTRYLWRKGRRRRNPVTDDWPFNTLLQEIVTFIIIGLQQKDLFATFLGTGWKVSISAFISKCQRKKWRLESRKEELFKKLILFIPLLGLWLKGLQFNSTALEGYTSQIFTISLLLRMFVWLQRASAAASTHYTINWKAPSSSIYPHASCW